MNKEKLLQLLLILVLLTVFCAPLYVVRIKIGAVLPTTFLELLIITSLIIWIGIRGIREVMNIVATRTVITLPMGLLVIGSLIGLCASHDFVLALGTWRAYILEPLFFFFVVYDLGTYYHNTRFFGRFNIISTIWATYLISGLFLAVWGLLQRFLGVLIVTPDQIGRAHALFNNGNALALYLGPILVILLNRINLKQKDILWWLLVGILGLAMFATSSMAGIAAVSVIIIFKLFPIFQQNLVKFFLAVSAGFFIFLLFISFFTPKNVNPWVRDGSTLTIRLCLWEGTRNLLFDHLLTGAGFRSFKELYSTKYVTCDAEALEYPHNLYLNFWVEIGLVGVIGITLLLITIFMLRDQTFYIGFVYLFLHGLFDVAYFKNDLALIFWVLVALWLVNRREARELEFPLAKL